MPKRIYTTVYTFDELSDDAKERARDWYRQGALDYDWWESTYDDAERAGLTLTEFDLDRRTISGKLHTSMLDSIDRILKDHGECCDTHKLAQRFKEQADIQKVVCLLAHGEFDPDNDLADLAGEYEQQLCEEYLSMLDKEYEYQMSDEVIDETIRANEYEFDEDGRPA